jgi:predicted permease
LGYTCALAYKVATTLTGFPLASLVISSLITSGALAAIYFVVRRRRRREKAAESALFESGAIASVPEASGERGFSSTRSREGI